MSLSPEAFENSIGSAEVTQEESRECNGSVLIYRDGRMVGWHPSGCDGWPVYFDHARLCVYTDVSGEDKLFPPLADRAGLKGLEEQDKASRLLYERAQAALKLFYVKEELRSKGLEPVTEDNYVSNCLRTESCDMEPVKERLQNVETIRLLHSALGLVTEAAELADMLKKHIFYGKQIDWVNAKEEVGDVMWYVGVAVDVMKTTMREIKQINIDKLRARYPEKFTEHHAVNRDLEKEHAILAGTEAGTEKLGELAKEVGELGDPEIKAAFGKHLMKAHGIDVEKEREAMMAEREMLEHVKREAAGGTVPQEERIQKIKEELEPYLSDFIGQQTTDEMLADIQERLNVDAKGWRIFTSTPRGGPNPFYITVVDEAKKGEEKTISWLIIGDDLVIPKKGDRLAVQVDYDKKRGFLNLVRSAARVAGYKENDGNFTAAVALEVHDGSALVEAIMKYDVIVTEYIPGPFEEKEEDEK